MPTVTVIVGCLVAWRVSTEVIGSPQPVLAPTGVLLSVTVTAYSTVVQAVQQTIAVLVGLAAALGFVQVFGTNAATMAILVAVALVVSRTVGIPWQNTQAPITALLVFALGREYGMARLLDIVVGALVGATLILMIPPRHVGRAAKDMADLADDLADLCSDLAEGVRQPWTAHQAQKWLARARRMSARLRSAHESAERATESLRFTMHRERTRQRLRRIMQAVLCLEHACHQMRGVARALADLAAGVRGLPGQRETGDFPEVFADLLDGIGQAYACFEQLLVAPGGGVDLVRLRGIVAEGERLERAARMEMAKIDPHSPLWTLYGALLDDCVQLRYEVDPDDGPHREAIPPRAREQADWLTSRRRR
ncbi:aromatic acid exporter family protein [Nonomuraea salmonea]|uniref:Aromatic acid exporter family protein n=1 Tax=Nonomuraea salmonea TaxID=46181 RepID=A0ABV5NHC6_9ACTN